MTDPQQAEVAGAEQPNSSPVNSSSSAAVVQPAPIKLRLSNPHPLIARMLEPESKPDRYGYVPPRNVPEVDVRVSKSQRRVALAVMDRVFKALEAVDVKVEIGGGGYGYQHDRGTFAVLGRDRAKVSLSEEYTKVPHVATPQELREKDQWSFKRIPKWDDVPTGKLTLHPGGVVDLSSEAAFRQLIEKSVAELQAALAEARARREAEEKRQHEEYKRQEEERKEKSRVEALHKAAKSLHEYNLLIAYIEEVRRFGRVPDDQRKEGQTLEEWLAWANWRARQLHPLG